MVDGLPSCEPGCGGGQSEVDTEGSVEVELVVTVCAELVVVGVELGGVEYWKIIRLKNFYFYNIFNQCY